MTHDFQVDTEGLRQDAAAVTAVADRITGAAVSAPAADPSPRWAATEATALAAGSARHLVEALGHDTADTADRIRAAATAYEEADARSAARLALSTTGTRTTIHAATRPAR
jgi:Excreted virulence factor EspC, type VII ESX diderm